MKRQWTKSQKSNHEASVSELTESFLIEFEACSCSHRRGNDVLFCSSYNRALHDAIKLADLSGDKTGTDLSSGSFIAGELAKPEYGHLNLHEANGWKRELLDLFYSSARNLISRSRLEETKHFCETVFKRDFLWNFRDISQFNPRIKPGLIYRSATLTLIQNERFFENLLSEKNIKTVIDLRSESEIHGRRYSDKSLEQFAWTHIPIDHLALSSGFRKNKNHDATTQEIYRFFALDSTDSVKTAFEAILKAVDPIVIHCHSGKDRTGFLVTLLHLLSGADLKAIYDDYLASEMDTKKEYLDLILDLIEKKNGIENYLLYCGLSLPQIKALKQKLKK